MTENTQVKENNQEQTSVDTDPAFLQFKQTLKVKKAIAEMEQDEAKKAILEAGLKQELEKDPELIDNAKAYAIVFKQYQEKALKNFNAKPKETQTQTQTQETQNQTQTQTKTPMMPQAKTVTPTQTTEEKPIESYTAKELAEKTGMSEYDALFVKAFPPKIMI